MTGFKISKAIFYGWSLVSLAILSQACESDKGSRSKPPVTNPIDTSGDGNSDTVSFRWTQSNEDGKTLLQKIENARQELESGFGSMGTSEIVARTVFEGLLSDEILDPCGWESSQERPGSKDAGVRSACELISKLDLVSDREQAYRRLRISMAEALDMGAIVRHPGNEETFTIKAASGQDINAGIDIKVKLLPQ